MQNKLVKEALSEIVVDVAKRFAEFEQRGGRNSQSPLTSSDKFGFSLTALGSVVGMVATIEKTVGMGLAVTLVGVGAATKVIGALALKAALSVIGDAAKRTKRL